MYQKMHRPAQKDQGKKKAHVLMRDTNKGPFEVAAFGSKGGGGGKVDATSFFASPIIIIINNYFLICGWREKSYQVQ